MKRSEQRCENCRFYVEGDAIGQCVRNPPTVVGEVRTQTYLGAETRFQTRWPEVLKAEWCGEWKTPEGDE